MGTNDPEREDHEESDWDKQIIEQLKNDIRLVVAERELYADNVVGAGGKLSADIIQRLKRYSRSADAAQTNAAKEKLEQVRLCCLGHIFVYEISVGAQ